MFRPNRFSLRRRHPYARGLQAAYFCHMRGSGLFRNDSPYRGRDGTTIGFTDVSDNWLSSAELNRHYLDFPGTDEHVDIEVPFASPATVCCWMDFGSISATKYFFGGDGATTYGIRYDSSTLLAYTGDAVDTASWSDTGGWVHYACVNEDDDDFHHYIDGTFVGTSSTGANNFGNLVMIGGRTNGSFYFDGPMTDILVWDRDVSELLPRLARPGNVMYDGLIVEHRLPAARDAVAAAAGNMLQWLRGNKTGNKMDGMKYSGKA